MIHRSTDVGAALRSRQRGFVLNPYRFAVSGGDPSWANVTLLLHGDGTNGSTTVPDSSLLAHTVTATNGAALSTAQKKFGTASLMFDGSNDEMSVPGHTGFAFGTGDFTVETWVRFDANTGPRAFIGTYTGATTGWTLNYVTSGGARARFMLGDTVKVQATWTPSNGVWYHLAVTRHGTDLRLFVDGTQIGSTATDSTDFADLTQLTMGRLNLSGGIQPFDGNLDDVRITKGVARYTGTFTPPVAAFPNF